MTAPRWSTLGIGLLLTLLGLAILWSVHPPYYFTNDDVVYRLQVAGEDVPDGTPTKDMFFTHAALAAAAVEIQRALPGFPVWDAILAATFASALSVLGVLAWNIFGHSRIERLCGLIALLIVASPMLSGIQFTISAILCAGAGALLALTELFAKPQPRRSILTLAAFLVLAGYLVRPMGAEAGALVTIALGLIIAIVHPARRLRLTSISRVAATVIAVFLILDIADARLYNLRGQGNYFRYHWQVIDLIEWGGANSEQQVEAVRKAAGWSENDWDLLRRRWGVDATLFGFDRLTAATEAARSNGSGSRLGRTISRFAGALGDSPASLLPQLATVGAVALGLAAALGTAAGVALVTGLLAAFVLMCVGIQAAFKELPFQLLAPIELCLIATVMVGLADHRRFIRRWHISAAVAVGLLLLLFQMRETIDDARAVEDQSRSISAQVGEVLSAKPSLLVLHADAFPFESWWQPFKKPAVRLPIVRLVWDNQDPRLHRFLKSRGLESLYAGMCRDPSVLLVAQPDRLDIVTRALAEHDRLKVAWTPIFLGTIRVWRCTPLTG